MKIEKAIKHDSNDLTELTIRSKSHWNYSKDQIEKWRDALTISETYILEKEVYKLMNGNDLIGYYSYCEINDRGVKLENLFIEPKFIGKGFGKMLMVDFLQRIRKTKFEKILLDADPNAEKFYEQFEFKTIGQLKTSIKNRFLPIMELKIKPANNKGEGAINKNIK
ncbi:GNAT family N-acetyltransferase [Aureispira anguillae]|uniref:GNAT family N-acetyltransferase n=1 Tax=Aureispira anguillae TaxID=2864201 RepID=A0A915YK78_9BACT|nr:GNAT family N-acetyltransferase [Aureispira anguillae]BDS14446.1 GNAT family N-acetyltransferase [Aureispira anguillae]